MTEILGFLLQHVRLMGSGKIIIQKAHQIRIASGINASQAVIRKQAKVQNGSILLQIHDRCHIPMLQLLKEACHRLHQRASSFRGQVLPDFFILNPRPEKDFPGRQGAEAAENRV